MDVICPDCGTKDDIHIMVWLDGNLRLVKTDAIFHMKCKKCGTSFEVNKNV